MVEGQTHLVQPLPLPPKSCSNSLTIDSGCMSRLSIYMSNLAKTRMDFSCHAILRGIYVGLG